MRGQLNMCLMAAEMLRAPLETSLPFPQVRESSAVLCFIELRLALPGRCGVSTCKSDTIGRISFRSTFERKGSSAVEWFKAKQILSINNSFGMSFGVSSLPGGRGSIRQRVVACW